MHCNNIQIENMFSVVDQNENEEKKLSKIQFHTFILIAVYKCKKITSSKMPINLIRPNRC